MHTEGQRGWSRSIGSALPAEKLSDCFTDQIGALHLRVGVNNEEFGKRYLNSGASLTAQSGLGHDNQ